MSLTAAVKQYALDQGADLVGVVAAAELPEHREAIAALLPGAVSVVVLATRHNPAALGSANLQAMQLETAYTYQQVSLAAKRVERFLDGQGHHSLAVPAFLPVDMAAPKYGLRGEICWRRAGVRAGLGSYGENGLLVTRQFGSAIRLSGVVTSAELEADSPQEHDTCDHCMRCVEACPVQALSGGGKINKKSCGEAIFKFGFRSFQRFMMGILEGSSEEARRIAKGYELRELWQTFMTGNYYYCFKCQAQCPASEMPDMR